MNLYTNRFSLYFKNNKYDDLSNIKVFFGFWLSFVKCWSLYVYKPIFEFLTKYYCFHSPHFICFMLLLFRLIEPFCQANISLFFIFYIGILKFFFDLKSHLHYFLTITINHTDNILYSISWCLGDNPFYFVICC